MWLHAIYPDQYDDAKKKFTELVGLLFLIVIITYLIPPLSFNHIMMLQIAVLCQLELPPPPLPQLLAVGRGQLLRYWKQGGRDQNFPDDFHFPVRLRHT